MDEGYEIVDSKNYGSIEKFVVEILQTSGQIKLLRKRTISKNTDIVLIFETRNEAYEIRLIQLNSQYYIDYIKSLNTGLNQQKYVYKKFS